MLCSKLLGLKASAKSAFRLVLVAFFGLILVGCNTGFGRSGNNDLDSLSVSLVAAGTSILDPTFGVDVVEYEMEVSLSTESVVVKATVDDELATMTLNGESLPDDTNRTVALAVGVNVIDVVVTAENEFTKTYSIEIRRSSENSADATLSALEVDNVTLSPEFSSASEGSFTSESSFLLAGTRITATRSNAQSTLGLAKPDSEDDTELQSGTPQPVSVNVGENRFVVKVTAGDRTVTQDYAITITRGDIGDLNVSGALKASSPSANDDFGASLAVSENDVIIGAPGEDSNSETNPSGEGQRDSGAVYARKYDNGVLGSEQFIKASPNIVAEEKFGFSVAVAGNTLAVGAPGGSGKVYIFERSSEDDAWDWLETLESSTDNAEFGYSIALDENYLAVGAPGQSAVFVFRKDGNTWNPDGDSLSGGEDNASSEDRFGHAVQLNAASTSPQLVVGAPLYDGDGTIADSGAVYVYTRSSNNNWSGETFYEASNRAAGDQFGRAVAISGDYFAAGAPYEDSDAVGVATEVSGSRSSAGNNYGAVYLINIDSRSQVYVKPSFVVSDLQFGSSLSMSANMLAVGVSGDDSSDLGITTNLGDTGKPNSGAVYVYALSGSEWSSQLYIKSSNADDNDNFGSAVILSNGRLFSTATGEDTSVDNSGAIYITE